MEISIPNTLKTELVARGYDMRLMAPNGSMMLSDAYTTAIDLIELFAQQVRRREKICRSVDKSANRNYEDVTITLEAIKATLAITVDDAINNNIPNQGLQNLTTDTHPHVIELATPVTASKIEETLSDVVYHYTSSKNAASIIQEGLWSWSSATNLGTYTSQDATNHLCILHPIDVVIKIRNADQFVMNKPAIIEPHAFGSGGGINMVNPKLIQPIDIVCVRSLGANISIRDTIKKELISRGFNECLVAPNETMKLPDTYFTIVELIDLFEMLVVKNEKLFRLPKSIGTTIAFEPSYTDILTAYDGTKAVLVSLMTSTHKI